MFAFLYIFDGHHFKVSSFKCYDAILKLFMRKRADTKELGVFTLFYNLRFYPTEIFMEGLSAISFSFFLYKKQQNYTMKEILIMT